MSEENKENEPKTDENLHSDLISQDDSEEFQSETSDENAIDAEVLSETKTPNAPQIVEPPKELTGIYALLANIKTEQEVSIIVKRLKDGQFKGQFRVPCDIDKKVDVVLWDNQPYPDATYSYIRKQYGGGRYLFQLQYNGGFQQAWTDVLNDPAELSELEISNQKATANTYEPQRTQESSQPFADPPQPSNPFDVVKNVAGHFREMKEVFETFAPPLPPPPAPPVNQPLSPTVAEQIQLTLLDAAKGTDFFKDVVFGIAGIKPTKSADTGNSKPPGFFAEIGHNIATNPKVGDFVGDLLSGIASIGSQIAMAKLAANPATMPTMPPGMNLQPPPMQPPPAQQQPPPVTQPPTPPKNEPQAQQTPETAQPSAPIQSPVKLIFPA